MQVKLLAVLLAVVMFSGMAAALPDINVMNRDGNYYYPSATTTITWTTSDANAPTDFNFIIYYVEESTWSATEITSLTEAGGAPDRNSNTFCSAPISAVSQICSYVWTLPTGLDGNYVIDINGYNITNSNDVNALSGSVYIDSNACDTGFSIASDTVTLVRICTGWGMDENGGTETTFYGYSRQGGCPDNITTTYTVPFNLSFGEFVICAYSTDGLGNTETTVSTIHTADSDAFNIALLTEMALAALLMFVILGGVVLRNEQLTANMMIALIVAAVVIAISIYIFAVVL
jgi:hypothetical protein